MPESPRARMKRQPNRLRSPHSKESLEPPMTRKGVLAHPGSLALGFAAIAFFVYVFNLGGVQTWSDSFASGLNTDVQSHNNEVSAWFISILPYLAMALVALAVFVAMNLLSAVARSGPQKKSKRKKGKASQDAFIKVSGENGVSERVAREAYSLLAPLYGKDSIVLSDSLGKKLKMTPAEIADMQGTLMRYNDRQVKVGDAGAAAETVLDLMMTVEKATVRSVRNLDATAAIAPVIVAPVVEKPVVVAKAPVVELVAPKPAPVATATFIRPFRPEKKVPESVPNPARQGRAS